MPPPHAASRAAMAVDDQGATVGKSNSSEDSLATKQGPVKRMKIEQDQQDQQDQQQEESEEQKYELKTEAAASGTAVLVNGKAYSFILPAPAPALVSTAAVTVNGRMLVAAGSGAAEAASPTVLTVKTGPSLPQFSKAAAVRPAVARRATPARQIAMKELETVDTWWGDKDYPDSVVLGIGKNVPSKVFGVTSGLALMIGLYCIAQSNLLNILSGSTVKTLC